MTTTTGTPQTSVTFAQAVERFKRGDTIAAKDLIHAVLRMDPQFPEALHLLGMIHYAHKDPAKARQWLSKALSLCPHKADLHNDMGLVLLSARANQEAVQSFEKAIIFDPAMAEAYYNKGLAYKQSGCPEKASAAFKQALKVNPGYASAHFSLGNLMLDRRQYALAEHHFCAAIEINPNYIAAYNHLSICLCEQDRLTEASQWLNKALQTDPVCADTICNLGNVARRRRHFSDAIRFYRQAIQQRPDFTEAHINLALVLLLCQDFENGWREYEWRLRQLPVQSGYPNRHGLPLWQDQPLRGKRILVYDEQGYGDVFMFSRYLFKLKVMGARVVFETKPALYNLFKHFPAIDETVQRHKHIQPHTRCDYCIPLASLPGRFKTRLENITGKLPYLFSDPRKKSIWSRSIAGKGLKIGLVWQGSNADRSRRCDPGDLEPLFKLPGTQWYGLQKDIDPEASDARMAFPITHLGPQLDDFDDTAAVIANLDLIISIDTAVAHLAGAMGKPVWVFLPLVPDWRWLLDVQDSPWYSSMRLYRQQSQGNWHNPVARVVRDLSRWLDRLSQRPSDEMLYARYRKAAVDYGRGDFQKAENGYRQIRSAVADHHPTLAALGLLYLKNSQYQKAIDVLQQAVAVQPDDPLCLNNIGLAFQQAGRPEAAISAFSGAVACRPDFKTAYHNMGNVYWDLGLLDEVIQWYAKALDLCPQDANAQQEIGKLYLKKLDTTRARRHFEKAIELDPQLVSARISLATTALMQGDFDTGWKAYRWRFKNKATLGYTYPGRFLLPRWQGEAFHHRRLIVHAEQGLGDTLQFSRFLPYVKALGGEVIFQVQDALRPLFNNFSGVDHLQCLPARQPERPQADLYIPLLDLPLCLGTTLDSIPAKVPYIQAAPEKTARWRIRFNSNKLKIGIVWQGNPHHFNDHKRSIPADQLLEFSRMNDVQLYSFQKDIRTDDYQRMAGWNRVIALGDELKDFDDTAAAIACLDLVLSVDTAVAHLAGAMGKQVWVLLPFLPDWRWLLGRTDTPWYPTMTLFRQPTADNWKPVLESVQLQLKSLLHGNRSEKNS